MTYVQDHAGALADVAAAGALAVFSKTKAGTFNPLTEETDSAITTTVSGRAIKSRDSYKRYEALKLVVSDTMTLFWVPTTYGQLPEVGMEVTWAGRKFTAREISPLMPDGTVIAARIIISR